VVEAIKTLIDKADYLFKQHKYHAAAKIYYELVETTLDNIQKTVFYRKAAEAYHELGSFDQEAECLLKLSNILEGEEKIDCLVSVWRTYIMAIAVFQYETGFEWKGESDNLDEAYNYTIRGYFEKAVNVLNTALLQRGVDKNRLLEKLGNECAKRQNEDGWGADQCWKTIKKAWHARD
jgi:tetratricopeptide (TPR) repeat protein